MARNKASRPAAEPPDQATAPPWPRGGSDSATLTLSRIGLLIPPKHLFTPDGRVVRRPTHAAAAAAIVRSSPAFLLPPHLPRGRCPPPCCEPIHRRHRPNGKVLPPPGRQPSELLLPQARSFRPPTTSLRPPPPPLQLLVAPVVPRTTRPPVLAAEAAAAPRLVGGSQVDVRGVDERNG